MEKRFRNKIIIIIIIMFLTDLQARSLAQPPAANTSMPGSPAPAQEGGGIRGSGRQKDRQKRQVSQLVYSCSGPGCCQA